MSPSPAPEHLISVVKARKAWNKGLKLPFKPRPKAIGRKAWHAGRKIGNHIRKKLLWREFNCRTCGKLGHTYPSEGRIYCSASCRSKHTNLVFGNPNKGRRYSDEQKLLLSQAHIGLQSGSNHPRWKGGTTTERSRMMSRYEYRQWRSAVFQRDNFTCQRCGVGGGCFVMAHHMKPWSEFPDLRYDINNGITLCKACHAKEDKVFARFCGVAL